MPRAGDDRALPDPREPPVGVRPAVDRAGDRALAERAALVRAEIRDGVVVTADVEQAELAPAGAHDAMRPLGDVLDPRDHVIPHAESRRKNRRALPPMILRRASAPNGR